MSFNGKNKIENESFKLNGEQREVLSDSKNLSQEISQSLTDGSFHEKFRVNDNHIHSDFTDGVLSPYRLADIAAMQGMTNITVTDHNTTKPARMTKKYAQKHYPTMQVNIGIELSTDKGHVILANLPDDLNLDFPQPGKMTINEYKEIYPKYQEGKEIYPGMSLELLLEIVQNRYPQVTIIFPHPFDGMDSIINGLKSKSATNFGGVVKNVGGIEKTENFFKNGVFIEGYNQTSAYNQKLMGRMRYEPWSKMKQYAENSKENTFISGTDTHIGQFGLVNIVKKGKNNETVFDQMKDGNFAVIKKLPSKKNIVDTIKEKIDSSNIGRIISDDVRFYSSRLLDYFINEQKLHNKDFVDHSKMDEIKDIIGKYIRIYMYSKIYNNRIKDVLNWEYPKIPKSDMPNNPHAQYDPKEVLRRLKNISKKGASTRFGKELISPIGER